MISILVSMAFFVFVLVCVNLCVCEFVCVEWTAKKMVGVNCLLLVSRKNGWSDEPKVGQMSQLLVRWAKSWFEEQKKGRKRQSAGTKSNKDKTTAQNNQ